MPPSIGIQGGGQHPGPTVGGGGGAVKAKLKAVKKNVKNSIKRYLVFIIDKLLTVKV